MLTIMKIHRNKNEKKNENRVWRVFIEDKPHNELTVHSIHQTELFISNHFDSSYTHILHNIYEIHNEKFM